MPFAPTAHDGTVHRFAPGLVAFEHKSSFLDPNPNTLIWIGGLGDGLLTVNYPTKLAKTLPSDWILAQALLSSAYKGWGTSSLKQDANELAQCVDYFQKLRPGAKVVLMGHSTGCQDCMEYLVGEGQEGRPAIQGAILQAPVSDREALVLQLPKELYDGANKLAQEWIDEGRGDDVLPNSATNNFFGGPVTAKRWLSLASPDKRGDDDFFSSDLDTAKLRSTFGAMEKQTPVLFLYGGEDEYAPPFVQKKALLEKWTDIIKEGGGEVDEENGGVVEGAYHNLQRNNDQIVGDLCNRVNGFLRRVGEAETDTGAHL